jgi:hypothetical protein
VEEPRQSGKDETAYFLDQTQPLFPKRLDESEFQKTHLDQDIFF